MISGKGNKYLKKRPMKKTIFFYAVMLCFFTNSGISQDDKIFQSDKLVNKWETPPELLVPESVCFDPAGNVLYVTDINGKPAEKDGNGFISKLSIDGKILELRWMTGLNAPKGMGIYNGNLFVTDIDRVAEIDITNKKIIKFYDFPDARFLNDIAIDQKGAVYISDMMSARIYRIYEDKTDIWLDDEILTGPNGLFVDGNQLLIGCGKIVRAGTDDKKITAWIDNTGNIDGLEGTGDGRYLFSDWQGNVYLVGTDKKMEKILNTSSEGINAADIEFIPSGKLLLVPTFNDNRVMAYELK
jgi:sugar lactone lactonase YvrE